MIPYPNRRRARQSDLAIWAALAFAVAAGSVVLGAASAAVADVDPIVRHMFRNLRLVDEIGEGIAIDDFALIQRASRELGSQATEMKNLGAAELQIPNDRYPRFLEHLEAQQDASAALHKAAVQRNGNMAALGLERLLTDGCVACHDDFRTGENDIRPAVLFMTTFLMVWRDINRGIVLDDLGLVIDRARDLQAMGRVLAWDQVATAMFSMSDASDLEAFRKSLRDVMDEAARIETAAREGDPSQVISAAARMWRDGCVSCHERFRKAD